jgi:hypothetical protein
MGITLHEEVRTLLDGVSFAQLTMVMADGSPQVAPVWLGREADRLLIGTEGTPGDLRLPQ